MSITELRSVTEGRPGLARHSRIPGFPPIGPTVGGVGPGPPQKAGRLSGPLHGWNGHGRSLVPSTGGAWPGGRALRCYKREKKRRRTEERREEEKRREERSWLELIKIRISLVFSNKKFCLWFSFVGVAKETKSWSKSLAEVVVLVLKHATS